MCTRVVFVHKDDQEGMGGVIESSNMICTKRQ
jgi:hypothetical protein